MLNNIGARLLNTMNVIVGKPAVHIPVYDPLALRLALEQLKMGSVIAVPTDTVYGLACDATNKQALEKLYDIKERCPSKPLAICLGDASDIENWANVQYIPHGLLNSLLPGPFTFILECVNRSLHKSLKLDGKVGIRVPAYDFIQNLSRQLGKPLALTSANLSNEHSAVDVSGFRSIWNRIPIIFDGGRLDYEGDGSASTIIDLSKSSTFSIIRKGAACEEVIRKLNQFGLINNIQN